MRASRPPGSRGTRANHPTVQAELATLYDEPVLLFTGQRHARYIRPDVLYHVATQVIQGRYLLRPSRKLNQLIAGVLGRAQEVFPDIELFAYAFMSNHVHLQLRGPAVQFVSFVGYVKREISRRWGGDPEIDWPGAMWEESFFATALPTEESQLRCLEYILSQGVKENLVERPAQWPGVHCAKQLIDGEVLEGTWLNGTGYGRAKDANSRRLKPVKIRKSDYEERKTVEVSVLPVWSNLSEDERNERLREMESRIVETGRSERERTGKKVLGARRIMRIPRTTRSSTLSLEWFERRKRMVCWADPRDPRTRAYHHEYRLFQGEYQAARLDRLRGETPVYPPGAFVPGHYKPPEDLLLAA